MSDYWVVDVVETKPHCLILNSPDGNDYRAMVKWNGCIHFETFMNGDMSNPENRDYIHYFHLDSEIRRLLDLRRQAKRFFGMGWK